MVYYIKIRMILYKYHLIQSDLFVKEVYIYDRLNIIDALVESLSLDRDVNYGSDLSVLLRVVKC